MQGYIKDTNLKCHYLLPMSYNENYNDIPLTKIEFPSLIILLHSQENFLMSIMLSLSCISCIFYYMSLLVLSYLHLNIFCSVLKYIFNVYHHLQLGTNLFTFIYNLTILELFIISNFTHFLFQLTEI